MKYRRVPAEINLQWVSNLRAKGWGSGWTTSRAANEYCRKVAKEVLDAAPSKTDWVMLTTDDINKLYFSRFNMRNLHEFARAIEALVHSKNQ